jgi:TRAP-type mannitol/chloroaromatic compound transport system permease small subunit
MVNRMVMMRALMFLIILSLLTVLVAQIDVIIYKSYLFTEISNLYSLDPASNKWIVSLFLLIGFIYAICTGIKEKLQKNGKKS